MNRTVVICHRQTLNTIGLAIATLHKYFRKFEIKANILYFALVKVEGFVYRISTKAIVAGQCPINFRSKIEMEIIATGGDVRKCNLMQEGCYLNRG